jgi:hypothetical protein
MEAIMGSDFVAGEERPKNEDSLYLRDVDEHLEGYRLPKCLAELP